MILSGPLSPNCKFIAFRLYGFGTILISDKELPEGRRKYAGSLVLVQNKLLFKGTPSLKKLVLPSSIDKM